MIRHKRLRLPRCAGCRRRIRDLIHLHDTSTDEHWHTACRDGALTT